MRFLLFRLWFPVFFLLGCDLKQYSVEPTPVKVNSLSAEAIGLPNPNSYQVRLSWSGLKPATTPIYRESPDGSIKKVGSSNAEEGFFTDNNVVAGESYTYFFSNAPDSQKAAITVPVDFVAAAYDTRWQNGIIKGYRRLFLSELLSNGVVDIEVDEIILWEHPQLIIPFIATSFSGTSPDGSDGRSASNVKIKARKMWGPSVFLINVKGQSGGKGKSKGGNSGAVDIEITEPTQVQLTVMSGRSRKGDQLLAKEVPKSELGLLPTIRFVSGGQELMAFDEKYYPVSKTGLYQDLPNRFLATDGYVYSIELDEEVSPPVFRTSNRTYIYEAFTIASKGGILFDTLAGAYPIFREALKGSWQLLWEINSRIADIYNGLEHQIEIEVEVPESFSANLERRAAVMEKLVKSMPSFKRFVQKNQIRKLIYSFKEGASSFSDGVLTIRSEELELSE